MLLVSLKSKQIMNYNLAAKIGSKTFLQGSLTLIQICTLQCPLFILIASKYGMSFMY